MLVGGIALAILLLALVQSTLRYHTTLVVARLSQQIVVQLRSDVYDKLQRLSFRFFDANETSSIINRVAGDVQAMRLFVDGVIIEVLTVLLSLAVYLAYMLSIHVGLTLASLATTPLLWICAVWFSRVVKPAYRHNRQLSDQMILTLVREHSRRAGRQRLRPAAGRDRQVPRRQSRRAGSQTNDLPQDQPVPARAWAC